MLRTHFGLHVHDETFSLCCLHCCRSMDAEGDHGIHCKTTYGISIAITTFKTVCDTFFSPAGLSSRISVSHFVQVSNLRPAGVLAHYIPLNISFAENPGHVAYDITFRSFFSSQTPLLAARSLGGAAEAAHYIKMSTFQSPFVTRTPF